MDNVTQVHFKDGQECVYHITGLKQWDIGQKLEISGLDVDEHVEVHFSLQQYEGVAMRMLGMFSDGILHTDIPNFIMEGPEYICTGAGVYSAYAWVYVSDTQSAETIRKMEFVIKSRPKPDDYAPPNQPDLMAEVIERVDKLEVDKLTKPETAKVGQILQVKAVNEDGTITLESVDMPANIEIVQELGDSEDKVMSQKGVTDAINSIPKQSIQDTASGTSLALTDSANEPIVSLKLSGKSTQNGITTLDNPIPIKSTGDKGSADVYIRDYESKNLFNIDLIKDSDTITNNGDGSITVTAKTVVGTLQELLPTVKVGDVIAFNCSGATRILLGVTPWTRNTKKTMTESFLNRDISFAAGTIRDIQFEYDEVTEYKPYYIRKTNIQVPETFGGFSEQACDLLDSEKGTINLNVTKHVFTGDENFEYYPNSSQTESTTFYWNIDMFASNEGLCTHLPYDVDALNFTNGNDGFAIGRPGFGGNYHMLCIRIQNSTLGVTSDTSYEAFEVRLEVFKSYLKGKYNAGDPITVYYATKNPQVIELSEEDKQKIKSITTEYPACKIENSELSHMEVEYVCDTKGYIDKKVNEIAVALVASAGKE